MPEDSSLGSAFSVLYTWRWSRLLDVNSVDLDVTCTYNAYIYTTSFYVYVAFGETAIYPISNSMYKHLLRPSSLV